MADPQIVDPHSYPGRPWPLSSLTVVVSDNYLRRGYNEVNRQLDPDSIFFLGDLFDGGREWKTTHGDFSDAEWSQQHPQNEQRYVKKWRKKYGDDFWLREYARFGSIFFPPWVTAGETPEAMQRRRKLVASLPGNHDLGFGADVKVAVRDRFEAFFGPGNRVDVIGNHTIVSVDTVSMSAASSDEAGRHDLRPIYMPSHIFLNELPDAKKKAVEKELRFLRGEVQEPRAKHKIEDLEDANFDGDKESFGEDAPELPTILLTHVPLYRAPGTPCGPLREHWPPTTPPKGQTDPVVPDNRNAISLTRGFQYSNVLAERDSMDLVRKVGNVVHAFSGDDHDYCEVVHDESQGSVREITVKSFSMVMSVSRPGFLMVSLHNPIDERGRPLAGNAGQPTMQTHLCLLPDQIAIYLRYIVFGVATVLVLGVQALRVAYRGLPRFGIDPELLAVGGSGGVVLPSFKAKMDDYDEYALPSAGFSASRASHMSHTRDRSGSFAPGGKLNGAGGRKGHSKQGGGRWGWSGGGPRMPRIQIPSESEDPYPGAARWKAASAKPRSMFRTAMSEWWAMSYRTVWMAVAIWVWMAHKG